jgi:hypothetical protein
VFLYELFFAPKTNTCGIYYYKRLMVATPTLACILRFPASPPLALSLYLSLSLSVYSEVYSIIKLCLITTFLAFSSI